jgi:hypothetical protein
MVEYFCLPNPTMRDNERESCVNTASRYANSALKIQENSTVLARLHALRIAQCTTATLTAMLPLLQQLTTSKDNAVHISEALMDAQRRGVPE